MFTDCPSCGRQFRIQARHLSAAGGQVRCGYCGEQFGALERLRDAPLPRTARAEVGAENEHFDIPEEHTPVPQADATRSPRRESRSASGAVEIPPELMQEPAVERSRARSVVWGTAALVLFLGALAQAAWFNRDELLRRFPQVLPAARGFCARLNCELIRHRDLNSISLINRDVRLHPVYEDALLVNATMANGATQPQPFPSVQLVLLDTGGRAIAQRVFEPGEYLDASIDLDRGMDPGVPVHFALEVAGAGDDAVGFEFGFL